jgi:hypothetical protein
MIQGTPPFMALEIMLKSGQSFCHNLHHDLESILYVIIWVCTHMTGVTSEHEDLDNLYVCQWCGDLDVGLRQLGLVKLSYVAAAKLTILTQFAEYWNIMKPFILDLITAFFPLGPAEPNEITLDKMLTILQRVREDILVFESDIKNNLVQDVKTLSSHYAMLENGKQHRLGQDAVMVPNKRIKQSVTNVGVSSWMESFFEDA